MTLEELYLYAEENGIEIDWTLFQRVEALSAPILGSYVIAIDPTKLKSMIDEKMKLSHELGHCLTDSFYALTDDAVTRKRCENRATNWAIKKLVPAKELERAIKQYTYYYELADYFDVSEDFIRKACEYYAKSERLRYSC